jgi:hypothetical protein
MDRERIEAMMADYLGRELDREAEERFLSALKDHPDLACEVEDLQGTLAHLHTRLRPGMAWRRLAAAVVLAFLAGMATDRIVTAPPPPPAAETWEADFASAYMSSPGESRWARSLVALSRAMK